MAATMRRSTIDDYGGRISVIGLLEGLELSGPSIPLLLNSPVIQAISTGSPWTLASRTTYPGPRIEQLEP